MRRAVVRLRQAIQGDVPDVPLDLPRDACYTGSPALTQTVDDVIVLVHYAPKDQSSGARARAWYGRRGVCPWLA